MLTKTPQQKPPTNQMHHGDVQKRKPFGFDPPPFPRMIIQHAYYASTLNKTNFKNIKDFFFTQINV